MFNFDHGGAEDFTIIIVTRAKGFGNNFFFAFAVFDHDCVVKVGVEIGAFGRVDSGET